MEHVAVTGQSFGGAIALEMGSARLNFSGMAGDLLRRLPRR